MVVDALHLVRDQLWSDIKSDKEALIVVFSFTSEREEAFLLSLRGFDVVLVDLNKVCRRSSGKPNLLQSLPSEEKVVHRYSAPPIRELISGVLVILIFLFLSSWLDGQDQLKHQLDILLACSLITFEGECSGSLDGWGEIKLPLETVQRRGGWYDVGVGDKFIRISIEQDDSDFSGQDIIQVECASARLALCRIHLRDRDVLDISECDF